jgi:molybdopterin molybdotransferase
MLAMLTFEEALVRVLAEVPTPTTAAICLDDALGRVLVEDIRSPIDLPSFDNSAMDGYAVQATDVASANPASPVRLRLAGRLAAGEADAAEVAPGTCVRLFTGSPLPPGANAVVMQEDTRPDAQAPGEALILAPASPGENVRARGEDVKAGTVIAEAGAFVTPARLALIAAVGLRRLDVGCQPVVGLLATGSELTEPGEPLAPGRIYESNRAGLAALCQRAGAIARPFPLVPDTLTDISQALSNAFKECDAVVTSGGVSVGERDFLRPAFEQIGGRLEFWKVAIKPGRPFAFGCHEGKLLFGLPGNPVSALVTFLLLVRPALLRWQGAADVSLPAHPGVLTEPLVNSGERRHFMRVKVDPAGNVRSAGLQASHGLAALASANGLVDVPGQATLAVGSTVRVLRWES